MSVFFIVIELRSNTNAIQAQTYQAITSELNEWRLLNLDDINSGRTGFGEAQAGKATLQDFQRWRNNRLILWANYERAHFAQQRGSLGEEEWVRFDVATCRAYARDAWIWTWDGTERFQWSPTPFDQLLTPSFIAYIRQNCPQQ